jgi:hypothetical protein
MNSKNVGVLGLVAVAAIGGGIWLASERSASKLESGQALFPELRKSLNDATAVRIHTAGDTLAVEIARSDDTWTVTQRQGYPADDAKLRKLLLSFANAQLREEKTSNPKNYPSLGVEEVSDADATGVRIEVEGVSPAVNLIVGKQGPGLESQYVRKVGEEQSWLINTSIDTSSGPADWLRKTLLDITADRIQSATIGTKNAKPYTASKSSRADADFAVEPLPKGKELSSSGAANSLATALAGLTLADVRPASELEGNPEARATYRTFDGLVVEIDGWSVEDERFVVVRTSFDEALAERFKTPAADKSEQPAEGESAAATLETAAEAKDGAAAPNAAEEAKTLSRAVEGWAFEIQNYKYDAIFKSLDSMLKR